MKAQIFTFSHMQIPLHNLNQPISGPLFHPVSLLFCSQLSLVPGGSQGILGGLSARGLHQIHPCSGWLCSNISVRFVLSTWLQLEVFPPSHLLTSQSLLPALLFMSHSQPLGTLLVTSNVIFSSITLLSWNTEAREFCWFSSWLFSPAPVIWYLAGLYKYFFT